MKKKGFSLIVGAILIVALTLGACAPAAPAVEPVAEFPSRPIVVQVPYSPGGATDFQVRIVTMAAGLDKYFGQPIAVTNKPGGGAVPGYNWFIDNAKPDGYYLTSYNTPHFIAHGIAFPDKVKYNAQNMEPVYNFGADPNVFFVNLDSPFNTALEVVDYAKKNPEKLSLSIADLFGCHHIQQLQIEMATGAKFTTVPHAGGVPALVAVIAGEVDLGTNNLSDAYRSRDRLKILAIADLQRHEFLPDVPTWQELGIDIDNTTVNCRGLAAPLGTPEPILNKLSETLCAMLSEKKVIGKMEAGGSPMWMLTRAETRKFWDEKDAYLKVFLTPFVEAYRKK